MTNSTPASGSLTDFGYEEEAAYGVVNDTPALTTFRRLRTTLNLTKDEYESQELRDDRQLVDSRHGVRRAAGDIECELIHGEYDPALQALMGGIWAAAADYDGGDTDFDSVAASAANKRFTFVFATAGGDVPTNFGVKVGDRFTFSGLTVTANNTTFTITALTTTTIDVAETVTDGTADTDAGVTLSTHRKLLIGKVYRSFTFERAYKDIARYQVFKGMRFNRAALQLPPTGIATITWGLTGQNATSIASSSIDGVAAKTASDSDYGTLTIDAAAKTITRASGDFTASPLSISAGNQIEFTAAVLSNTGKKFTVVSVTSSVITVAEAINGGSETTYTLVVDSLPSYTAPGTKSPLVAVDGYLLEAGVELAVVTAMSFNIDNQINGVPVVAQNTVPHQLWGNRQMVTGEITVLFNAAAIALYNKFEGETESSLLMRFDDAGGSDWLQFFFPRIKYNTGDIGDAVAEGLPVTMQFKALKPTGTYDSNSMAVIQST